MSPEPQSHDQHDASAAGQSAASKAAHEAAIKKKADAFLKRVYEHDNVTITGGGIDEKKGQYALDEETLKYLVSHHKILELKKGELMVSSGADYGSPPDAQGHYPEPFYVVPGVGQTQNSDTTSTQALQIKTAHGEKIIVLVPESEHKYDAQYYKNNIQWVDKDMISTTDAPDTMKFDSPEAQKRYETLLAHIKEKADAEHSPGLILRLQQSARESDSTPGVASDQSFEGKDYLFLSHKALKDALATDEGAAALTKSIDAEIESVGRGDNTPEAVIKRRNAQDEAANFLNLSELTYADGRQSILLPSRNEVISGDTIKYMVANDSIEEVKREDIKSRESNPIFDKKDAQGNYLPVYIIPTVGDSVDDKPDARLMTTKEGQQYIMINEGYHKWDAAYVDKYENSSSQDLEKLVTDKKAITAEDFLAQLHANKSDAEFQAMQVRYQKLMESMEQYEGNTGLDKPRVLIDTSPHRLISDEGASTFTTSDDKKYIFFNKEFLTRALSSDEGLEQAKGVANHELTHILDKNQSSESQARYHNDPATSREDELRADLTAESPLGPKNPDALARYFEASLKREVKSYLDEPKNPRISADHPTDADLKAVSDWDAKQDPSHPAFLERIAALQEEARLMKQYEVKFAAEHKNRPMTKDEIMAESKAVVEQVLQEYRDGKLPPAVLPAETAPKAPEKAGANPSPQDKAEAVKASLGGKYRQDAASSENAHTPSGPTYVAATRPEPAKGAAQSV